jgi:hypothetical protein
MAAYVVEKVYATTTELAEHFKMKPKDADSLMRQRWRTVRDVQKRGDFWQVGVKDTPPERSQPRAVPAFKEYRPPTMGGPIRPGARDFEQIPSRIGDSRVPYMR